MPEQTIEQRIIEVLRGKGSMDSHQLSAALDLEWTAFSEPLFNMIRNLFNPEGPILTTRLAQDRVVYHLPDQTV